MRTKGLEEYEKGYRAGYQAGHMKGKEKKRSPEKGGLRDLTQIPPLVEWIHIEGDDETFSCPSCDHSFYSEECIPPNFCWYCGAKYRYAKKEGE